MSHLNIPQRPDITSIVEKIKSKEIKVLNLVTEHIKLAKEINPEINAFITILEESAIERAKEIDKKIEDGDQSLFEKKLLGIPFTVKDLYLVKGTKTTFASRFMEDFIAPYTSTVVEKCLDEGAILIGKTNCDPWGFGGSGENSGFGPTKHPLDFTKTPGGSSSGSAASLLAGVGFFSLGTDTGGSVRLPASFCGLYGYKPTYGRNSRYGIGAMGSSFDTPGFFARYPKDIEILEEIMEGRDINDQTTQDFDNNEVFAKKMKIGIPSEFLENLEGSIKDELNNEIDKLKDLGHEIVDITIPSTKYALSVYYILVPSEISSNRARYDGVRFGKKTSDNYEENITSARSKYFEDEVKRRIMIGTYSLSKGYADQFYKKASKVRSKLKREFSEAFSKVDLILSPVSPTTAFKLGEKTNDPIQMYLVDIYSVTANLVGIPAIAFPVGVDGESMPIGLQIMGNRGHDKKIMSLLQNR